MKNKLRMAAFAALALTGCATVSTHEKIAVDVQSSHEVSLTNVSATRGGGFVNVVGTLRPRSSAISRVGHVDVEFIAADGAELKTVRATPSVHIFSRNSSRRPTFTALADVADVATVRVTHHPDTMGECEL